MSADNGTYVLATCDEEGYSEFRVIQAHAIENIYDSKTGKPNLPVLIEYFGKAKVFLDQKKAMCYANTLEDELGTEHGICFIPDFAMYIFSEIEERLNGQAINNR